MKKLLACLLAACMLLGLAACASDPGTATDDPADSASGGGSTPAATADGDTVKIGVVAAIFAFVIPQLTSSVGRFAANLSSYLAQVQGKTPEQMKAFDRLGYQFRPDRSDEITYVFCKEDKANVGSWNESA